MPELPEVEVARRLVADAVGWRIAAVVAPDPLWLRRGLDAGGLGAAATGATITAAGRRGKLLLVELDGGDAVLGLHFGMTGRLQLGDRWAVAELEYASNRDEPVWERLRLDLVGARGRRRALRVVDPRRLGGVELDPDLRRLGPDALTLRTDELAPALAGSAVPLKARLLDQSRVAGLGNLLVDETLWRAGWDPARPAGELDRADVRSLAGHVRRTVASLLARGGSHTGDLQAERHRDGTCPRDRTPLLRRTIGGRTTYSCPTHQR